MTYLSFLHVFLLNQANLLPYRKLDVLSFAVTITYGTNAGRRGMAITIKRHPTTCNLFTGCFMTHSTRKGVESHGLQNRPNKLACRTTLVMSYFTTPRTSSGVVSLYLLLCLELSYMTDINQVMHTTVCTRVHLLSGSVSNVQLQLLPLFQWRKLVLLNGFSSHGDHTPTLWPPQARYPHG